MTKFDQTCRRENCVVLAIPAILDQGLKRKLRIFAHSFVYIIADIWEALGEGEDVVDLGYCT